LTTPYGKVLIPFTTYTTISSVSCCQCIFSTFTAQQLVKGAVVQISSLLVVNSFAGQIIRDAGMASGAALE
jgi:hypothetical protein